jgi:hypothetical protein
MRQNRKNRTVVNRFDLGRIQPTSIEVAKPETLRELAIRLEREERERREAPIRAAEQQLTETVRAMHDDLRKAWSQPLSTLKKFDRGYAESMYVPLGLPQQDSNADPTATAQSVKAEFKRFIDGLPARGYVIDVDGSWRFQAFIQTQIVFGDAAVTQASLQTMFDYLVCGQCFAATELRYVPELVPPVEAEPSPEPRPLTLEDVLQQGTDGSRDSDKRLRDAAEFDWLNEHRPMVDAFLNHLQTVWGFTPTDEQWKYIFGRQGLFVQKNWSHGDARNYDSARKFCARTGIFPSSMLTAGEVVEAEYARDNDWSKFNYQVQNLTRRGLYNRPRVEAGI